MCVCVRACMRVQILGFVLLSVFFHHILREGSVQLLFFFFFSFFLIGVRVLCATVMVRLVAFFYSPLQSFGDCVSP